MRNAILVDDLKYKMQVRHCWHGPFLLNVWPANDRASNRSRPGAMRGGPARRLVDVAFAIISSLWRSKRCIFSISFLLVDSFSNSVSYLYLIVLFLKQDHFESIFSEERHNQLVVRGNHLAVLCRNVRTDWLSFPHIVTIEETLPWIINQQCSYLPLATSGICFSVVPSSNLGHAL